jgi:hypothetical protein
VPAPRVRASADGTKNTGPRAKITAPRQRAAAAVRSRARPQSKRGTESHTTLPAGNGALLLLAVLAVPCVVASVILPIASIGITTAFVVLTRTLWMSHWMVRNRGAGRGRVALRTLLFPFALVGAAATAVVWPGVPVAVASGGALWVTGGGEIDTDWWQQPAPVTVAGVVFGMLCGGITGREIERIGGRLPDLRREGLRALAVLGGFVALCAAAVRAIALLLLAGASGGVAPDPPPVRRVGRGRSHRSAACGDPGQPWPPSRREKRLKMRSPAFTAPSATSRSTPMNGSCDCDQEAR